MKPSIRLSKILFLVISGSHVISQDACSQWIQYTWKNTAGIQTSMVTSSLEDGNNRLWFGTDQGLDSFNPNTKLWTHYTTINGLAGNFINRIFKDRDGSLWIATDYGISRFSDNVFTNFTVKKGLSSDKARSITQSPDGTLFFGTFGGGVCSYTPNSGFNKLPLNKKDSCILSLLALSDTAILIGTFNRGLILYQNDSAYSISNSGELKGKIIYSLFRNHAGDIWVTTDQGAQQYKYPENKVLPCPDSLNGKIVYSINENDSNDLVFGTLGRLYQFRQGAWTSFVPDNLVKSTSYFTLLFDSKGAFWVGTSSRGLFIRNGQTWANATTISPRDIGFLSICEGKDHTMWFASYDELYSYDGTQWNRIPLPDRKTEYDGIIKIASDTAGTIWCLRNNWRVYSYNGTSWKAYTGPGDFGGVNVSWLESDPYGNVWFAACNSGVFRYNGKSFSHHIDYSTIDYDAPYLFCYDLLGFYPDGKLITVEDNANLSFFDGTAWAYSDGMKGTYGVNNLAAGLNNTIWFATNNGIIQYKDDQIKLFSEGKIFISINVDQYGHVWAGNRWSGLIWYDGSVWNTLTTADGLSSNCINDIFFDSMGRIWLATENGINLSDNVTGITGKESEMPGIVALPNPFSDLLQFQYYSDKPGKAVIQFISQDGRIIKQVFEPIQSGQNILNFNANDWPEGLIICTVTMNGLFCRQKLVKIK